MMNEIERLSTDLATQAQGLAVTDRASANRATELILAGKDAVRKIKAFFMPLKEAANATHRQLIEKEKAELAKVEPIVESLSRSISSWRTEEERKRREAETEARRREEERKRLEEEALRKAREAEEKAERERQRLEAEAEKLRQEALKKADDAVALKRIEEEREKLRLQAEEARRIADDETTLAIDEAAKAEAAMAPAPIIPEAPRTAGLAMQDHWCFEVVDPMAVPREFLAVDEIKIGKVVRALKGQITIPGVRIFNRPIMASIGNRTKS